MLINANNLPEWKWPSFTPWEMRADRGNATPSSYETFVDLAFMDALQTLRSTVSFPIIVASYYRSAEYDESVGGKGPHRTGKAIDITISGERAYILTQRAFKMGFTGVGLKQHGPWNKRFIHLDILSENRPRIWTYN